MGGIKSRTKVGLYKWHSSNWLGVICSICVGMSLLYLCPILACDREKTAALKYA